MCERSLWNKFLVKNKTCNKKWHVIIKTTCNNTWHALLHSPQTFCGTPLFTELECPPFLSSLNLAVWISFSIHLPSQNLFLLWGLCTRSATECFYRERRYIKLEIRYNTSRTMVMKYRARRFRLSGKLNTAKIFQCFPRKYYRNSFSNSIAIFNRILQVLS